MGSVFTQKVHVQARPEGRRYFRGQRPHRIGLQVTAASDDEYDCHQSRPHTRCEKTTSSPHSCMTLMLLSEALRLDASSPVRCCSAFLFPPVAVDRFDKKHSLNMPSVSR